MTNVVLIYYFCNVLPMAWRVTNEPVNCCPSRGVNKHTQMCLKALCHLLSDVILSAWNLKKFTNFFKFAVFVGKECCFIIWLNTAYYTTKVSAINTQSSICINLLKWFEFWSQNMINSDQSTLLLYCCEDVKSHRSGGDTVSLNRFM